MNRIIKKAHLAIAILFLLSFSISWSSINNVGNKIDLPLPSEALLGAYEYTVENVPYEYSKGVLIIAKLSDTYTVKVKVTAGELEGEDVQVVDNSIKFKVFIEGQTVAVDLTVDGDIISGKSTSYDGTFYIQGKRHVLQD
jgi:hypothetical protein